jgi:serine/threonine protein phosphatase 1
MMSVGDIIDRGPYSLKALDLLDVSWFYMVKGNHDEMFEIYMLRDNLLSNGTVGAMWMAHGGEWVLCPNVDMHLMTVYYAPKIRDLPLVIHVDGEGHAKFNVVHAELVAYQPLSDDNLEMVKFKEEMLLWSRRYTNDDLAWASTLNLIQTSELSITYSGHNTWIEPLPFMRQINIDTGCCYKYYGHNPIAGNCLSMVHPASGTLFQCEAKTLNITRSCLRDPINNITNSYTDFNTFHP